MRFDNKSSFFVFLIRLVYFFSLLSFHRFFPLKNFIEFFFSSSIQGKSLPRFLHNILHHLPCCSPIIYKNFTGKWHETKKSHRQLPHHIHCIHLQFFFSLLPTTNFSWALKKINCKKMCEIFIILLLLFFMLDDDKSHLFTKEIRFFITNFQGNFQHHPIFIIFISFPPFACFLFARDVANKKQFFSPSSVCIRKIVKILNDTDVKFTAKVLWHNTHY